MPKDEVNVLLECYLEWSSDTKIDYSDLYILIDGVKNYVCTTSQYCLTFKGSVKKTHEIEFILCPKQFAKTTQAVFLKIPLYSDRNSMNHLMVE